MLPNRGVDIVVAKGNQEGRTVSFTFSSLCVEQLEHISKDVSLYRHPASSAI